MDPCYGLTHDWIRQLFESATVTEASLVALEHMSVHLHRVQRIGGLTKFWKNTISFAQDVGTWFRNAGLWRPFRPGDPVNSVRGPHGDMNDPGRPPVLGEDACVSASDRLRYAANGKGELVFPGRVREITEAGLVVVEYAGADRVGLEFRENIEHRLTLPWGPKVLRGTHVIMLRRGVGHGKVLEGLEGR